MKTDPWYLITAEIVAIPAFLISIWNLLSPYFLKLKSKAIPETQIQILESIDYNGNKFVAFNALFTIFSKGPEKKWDTYKFMTADMVLPDENKIHFACSTYIQEKGLGQTNASRNIPIAINGGQSKTTTAGFQSFDVTNWLPGTYKVSFYAVNSNGREITSKGMTFTLNQLSISLVQKINSTIMIPTEILK